MLTSTADAPMSCGDGGVRASSGLIVGVGSGLWTHLPETPDEPRLQQATEQLAQLNRRKQGKKRLGAEELQVAAQAIVTKQRVEGLLEAWVETTTRQRRRRRYGDRPEQTV